MLRLLDEVASIRLAMVNIRREIESDGASIVNNDILGEAEKIAGIAVDEREQLQNGMAIQNVL